MRRQRHAISEGLRIPTAFGHKSIQKLVTMTEMKGKTALVTGSTSGIGLGIAKALARQGANIVLNGFGDTQTPQADIRAFNVQAEYHGADMSNSSQIEDLMKFAKAKFGRIDILVNNVGIQHLAKVEDLPPERWDAVIATNLTSAFHTTRLALPAMRAVRWGRIINIASVLGLVASSERSAYVAAKHGLIGFSKTVALETATAGITVNAICPGMVLTQLVQMQIDGRAARDGVSAAQAQSEFLSEKQPSLQFTTVEQIGALVVFLCSPAADQVRGVAWQMDGGWTAQ